MSEFGLTSQEQTRTPLPEGYQYMDPKTIKPLDRAELMRTAGWNTSSVKLMVVDERHQSRGASILDVGVSADDGRLVGYGRLLYWGENGELSNFVVNPAHRGRGIGKAIIDERLSRAEAAGLESLYIPYLEPTNVLRSYYEQKGFHETEAGEIVRGPHPVSITGWHLPTRI